MAITDIQISEELETGAPSIKYRGNEGPQAPMQMAEADPLLVEEYQKYVFDMEEQGLQPMSFEEFRRQAIAGYAYGGIAGLDGRKRYGIGSWLKEKVRKIIPNEVSKVAQFAAPLLAPFNPLAAAVAGGLGSFDQTGSISKGLKSGLRNYGIGQLTRGIGGGLGNLQKGFNPFTSVNLPGAGTGTFSKFLSNPLQKSGGLGKFFDLRKAAKLAGEVDESMVDLGKSAFQIAKEKSSKKGTSGILKAIKNITDSTAAKIIIGASVGSGLYTSMTQGKEEMDLNKLARGAGMDIAGIRAEIQAALAGGEAAWAELQKKYPYVGEFPTKKAAEGGRIGYYAGGQSIPSEYTIEDARKTAMQDRLGGITEVMKQADLYRQGDIGQMYMAEGGDVDYSKDPNYKGWKKTYETNKDAAAMNEKHAQYLSYYNRTKKEDGGIMDLGGMEKDYRETGGFVPIGKEEKADDVPARLSVNEFVMTADAVRGMGDGDIDQGAKRMEDLMETLEVKGKKNQGALDMFEVSERLSEVI